LTGNGNLLEEFDGARVIVTGASGFIGLNLIRVLTRLNADVLVIDRNQPAENFPHAEFEWADLRHLDKTYTGDYLIHLAAITNAGYAEKYPLDTYEVNVLGTVNLLNHVKISKRVLFPSTALIYKASAAPLNENAEPELASTYAQSKFLGEQIVRFYCHRMGVGHTIVRFFNIFGPGQLSMYIVSEVFRQIIDEGRVVLRNGSVKRDLLYVEDCIDAVAKLAVNPAAENSVFNIGSGKTVSILELATTAVDVSGYSGIEITDLQEGIAYSPTAIVADIGKIQSTVEWCPVTTPREGLSKVWESYLSSR